MLGLLGYPLGHSLSEPIHVAFMEAADIRGSYEMFPVEQSGLAGLLDDLMRRGYSGLNVTFPHKATVLQLCRWTDRETALEAGAANTLVRRVETGLEGWHACNTDIEGFSRLVEEESLESSQFVVIGSGGAAAAVTTALSRMGCSSMIVCRRPWLWKGAARATELSRLQSLLDRRDGGVVVNATTLGWRDTDVIPVDHFPPESWVFLDLNYRRSWPWRNGLAESGVRVITGERMLVYQAAASFRLWTGIDPDVEAGLEAVRLAQTSSADRSHP